MYWTIARFTSPCVDEVYKCWILIEHPLYFWQRYEFRFILKSMKFLILILVLAISIQPLQAGFCDMDMEKSQETSHHMERSDDGNHDCCDSDDSDSQSGCESSMHCGPCHVFFSTLPSIYKFNSSWVTRYSSELSSNVVFPSHSAPPFRPPIAWTNSSPDCFYSGHHLIVICYAG